jgi:hypothetical protein
VVGRRLTLATTAAAFLSLPCQAAIAHGQHPPARATALSGDRCPGREIRVDREIEGSFARELQGTYVMLPFDVPAGTTAVRVKYCHDQPESPLSSGPGASVRHTLDLGLYEPRRPGGRVWGMREFRGWGGSSHPDVTVSAEGFSTEEQYSANPRQEIPGKTTRAFRPGRIRAGQWAIELGVAAVVSQSEGDLDGRVDWRVEIELSRDPSFADEPYQPARYRRRPARRGAGWYAGDLHVHAEHSAYGDATTSEALGYAFRPLSEGGAGLDFVTLSDYVSGSSWGEVGRYQPRHHGKLIARSAELITYHGHLNNHVTARLVDYRAGRILERRPDGSLSELRGPRPARDMLGDVRARGGFTQINHPTIFPSDLPAFGNFCRGCSWEYSDEETDYSRVDAIEIATGPSGAKTEPPQGPNPFTVTAIDFYERALSFGHHIAAVGVSDSHNAGRSPNPVTQAPIGEATTVVFAEELSEQGVECGVEAGHTYAKVTGNAGPDLRFEALPPGGVGPPAIMGDTVRAGAASFEARVLRGPGRELLVVKDGSTVQTVPVAGDDFRHRFTATARGRYRLQLQRGSTIETVSSPIWLEPGEGRVARRDCTPLKVRGIVGRRVRPRRRAVRVRCRAQGAGLRSCVVRAQIFTGRPGRKRVRVIGRGRVRMRPGVGRVRVRLNRLGVRLPRVHRRGRRIKVVFTARDEEGNTVRHVRRTRLLRGSARPRPAPGVRRGPRP